MEYWSFSCVLINHKGGGEKSAAVMKYAVRLQQLASLPALLWISQSDYTRCRLVIGEKAAFADEPSCSMGFTPLSAWHTLMAKLLRLSARRWLSLASPPCRPEMTRWHSGQADLTVIKRTRGASGHRLLVIAVVWPKRMKCEWLQLKMHNILQPKSPCTLFS